MASEWYATAPLSAPGVVLAVMQMPMPVGRTQPGKGTLAKLGAVTDASSEGFQIDHGERCPYGPANLPGAVADAATAGPEIGRVQEKRAIANAATSLTDIEVDSKGIDTDSRWSWSKSRTATTNVVRPNGVADAATAEPHVMLERTLT